MNLTTKRILIPVLLIIVFMLLIWLTLKTTERLSENNTTEPDNTAFDFSRNPTEELEKKGTITTDGLNVKQNLLSGLNGEAGVLFKSERFKVEYFPPLQNLDERFVVEINSVDFESVKEEVRTWFMAKGFSYQDACNLLITFYPAPDILSNFEEEKPVFDPVFKNCGEDF